MLEFKILYVEIANGEFLLDIDDNIEIKRYTLDEADEKFGSDNIDIKFLSYLNKER